MADTPSEIVDRTFTAYCEYSHNAKFTGMYGTKLGTDAPRKKLEFSPLWQKTDQIKSARQAIAQIGA